jgi:hypothetical protein
LSDLTATSLSELGIQKILVITNLLELEEKLKSKKAEKKEFLLIACFPSLYKDSVPLFGEELVFSHWLPVLILKEARQKGALFSLSKLPLQETE